jgi:hypothetical protein
MPNYRRLISYISAYEGAVKGKNIGFAKIETRGIQCKITVSVKRIYVGGNDIGVYLLAADQEIFLGNIFIRGGSGEFRTVVSPSDIEHSGINVEKCYGLTIHDVKNTWRSYTTIWEDAVAYAAEVDLESSAKVISEKKPDAISEEQIKRAVSEIEEEFPLKPDTSREASQAETSSDGRIMKEDIPAAEAQELPEEAGLQAENQNQEDRKPADADMDYAEAGGKKLNLDYTKAADEQLDYAEADNEQLDYVKAAGEAVVNAESEENLQYMEEPAAEPTEPGEVQEKEVGQKTAEPVDIQEQEAVFSEAYPCSAQDGVGETICYRADAAIQESAENEQVRPELGNPEELERLRQNEIQENNAHDLIWEKLKHEHTRILAFDYEDGCEILTIKPQDIGLLPRDTWVYGNNSFLLHGYYNYRYLILAKLLNPSGIPRYLLGIPGHYYSNERYMASMFGFPNFVLSKEQPMEDSRFGFWYTDVKLGG